MSYNTKFPILIVILLFNLIFITGCNTSISNPAAPPVNSPWAGKGDIVIADNAESTPDCTPTLTVSCEGAAYMSFSGDGENWTDWIVYSLSYDNFNIANKFYGTIFGSGEKKIYVKFMDGDGNLSPSGDLAYDAIIYEMPELRYFRIEPDSVEMKIGEEKLFTAIGWSEGKEYEVPIDGEKVSWEHCCSVGEVSPKIGLQTYYTTTGITTAGTKNITASYEGKEAGASIYISE